MTNEEFELLENGYLLDKDLEFSIRLNSLYNNLCHVIRKSKWQTKSILGEIVLLIDSHWENANKLPKDDLYMVLNCITLARSDKIPEILGYNEEEFQKLERKYVNSR